MQESTHRVRKPASEVILTNSSLFMQLAEHLTVLHAWSTRCLPGRRKPDMLHPVIVRMRGSMVSRLRPCMK